MSGLPDIRMIVRKSGKPDLRWERVPSECASMSAAGEGASTAVK